MTGSSRAGIGYGLLFVAAGMFPLLRGLGVITAGEISAPSWVVTVAGVLFVLGGLALVNQSIQRTSHSGAAASLHSAHQTIAWLLACLIVTGLSAIGLWVAFGPGAREFKGGITGSETEGRIAFGIGAFMTSLIAAWWWRWGIAEYIGRRGR
ncbi:MAG: hypothetical protein ACT4PY_02325 [Armatimonadota bacterium]